MNEYLETEHWITPFLQRPGWVALHFLAFAVVGAGMVAVDRLPPCGQGLFEGLASEFVHSFRRPNPEVAYETFLTAGVPEALNIDPLVLAGPDVVPLVLADVAKKSMPKRRYAIAFLGEGGFVEALPTLERILADATNENYVRGDALEAIGAIDIDRAAALAKSYLGDPDLLGDTARQIHTTRTVHVDRRSYRDALTGYVAE